MPPRHRGASGSDAGWRTRASGTARPRRASRGSAVHRTTDRASRPRSRHALDRLLTPTDTADRPRRDRRRRRCRWGESGARGIRARSAGGCARRTDRRRCWRCTRGASAWCDSAARTDGRTRSPTRRSSPYRRLRRPPPRPWRGAVRRRPAAAAYAVAASPARARSARRAARDRRRDSVAARRALAAACC